MQNQRKYLKYKYARLKTLCFPMYSKQGFQKDEKLKLETEKYVGGGGFQGLEPGAF